MENLDKINSSLNKQIQELERLYESLGFAGYLAVIGGVVILFTMVVAFLTDPNAPNSSVLNVDATEEVLFLVTGLVLVTLGTGFISLRAYLKHQALELKTKVDIARLGLATAALPQDQPPSGGDEVKG